MFLLYPAVFHSFPLGFLHNPRSKFAGSGARNSGGPMLNEIGEAGAVARGQVRIWRCLLKSLVIVGLWDSAKSLVSKHGGV